MAYNKDDQNEFALPSNGNGDERRKSSNHLPRYFRTQVNNKFLSSTIDQLMQPGVAEKLNGYYGRKDAKGYGYNDSYIGDVSKQREDYQLEPAAVIKDDIDNVTFYGDYNDYVNQLHNQGSTVLDHSILNRQEYYAWNPHIDWDKFTNFREYYWLPSGPQTVQVTGQTTEVVTTYKVTAIDNGEHYGYVFTPDGKTQNPKLTLYRGITYRFEIDAPGNPISFRTRKQTAPKWKPDSSYSFGERVIYDGAIYLAKGSHHSNGTFDITNWDLDTSFNLTNNISAQSVENGVVELKLDFDTPDIIYYMSDSDLYASGTITVKDIAEATAIDVASEIVGMKTYTTGSGIALSNGMKIRFAGRVTPETYASSAWYVEGVGDSIKLVSEEALNIPSEFTKDLAVEFDSEGFDRLPFSEAIGYPINKDYITINRSSVDGNLWSKYNRWFHKDVIEASALANNQEAEIDETKRATRPIVEFDSGLKLFNFGTEVKASVDLIDNFTKDAFSNVEGAEGYNIDTVDLTNGMRVIFTADTDPLVRGRIFEVQFITFQNKRQITLVETEDAIPVENQTVLCKQGDNFRGKVLWFDGTTWNIGQSKTSINQPPLFDVFDATGNSFSNSSKYESTTFTGTKIFSYKTGNGVADTELGFALDYRSIENVGDITFKFDLLSDTISYIPRSTSPVELNISNGYLRRYSDISNYETVNGWTKGKTQSTQPVIRQYTVDNSRTFYTVDVYEQSGLLQDLWLRVFVNNKLVFENKDYTTSVDPQNNLIITFSKNLEIGDNIVIKTRSSAQKTEAGKYEIASNLERNPLNNDIVEFTLGEVNDHVGTIIEEIDNFDGEYPGKGNLRDLGKLSSYGKRIVKHSAPINLSIIHTLDKDTNVPKALKYARREYGKFKRSFLQIANSLGFSGPVKEHVDLIIKEIIKDKTSSMPFYFSDMVPLGAAVQNSVEIEEVDNIYFALSESFSLETPSEKAVQVYLNGTQLVYEKDYTFNDQGFIVVEAGQQIGDVIDIYEYETTNGSYIPPTPTKLGLYPKFEPSIFVDDTYLEPKKVIQGHDGSITIAFDDFRDDLILELEKRIYNNLKVAYDPTLFDIYDYIPGHGRKTGVTQTQIDDAMISDFVQWLQLVDEDYTINPNFNRADQFTFNHTGMVDNLDHPIYGYWRGVYKYAYDTDRPHTHPWEMLGFTVKPKWWDEQYGEAPYTSNNLLMWEDIEAGIIRDPDTAFISNKKFVRPGLTTHLPVDEQGNLVSPIMSSFVKSYTTTDLNANFLYGDHSPVETAWRKGSEYPYALLTALFLTQPSNVMSVCFDRLRQKKDIIGQIIYENPNRQIRLSDVVFPNTVSDKTRVYTSGLINYVVDYIASKVTTTLETYKSNVYNLNNQIGFKVGGYTSKDKFKLILDSRTPLNKGNVFVPEENYRIFLNTSSPVKTVYYSGIIIEKQSYGFIIKGYNNEQPFFMYNQAVPLANDPLINVGGISSSYVLWEENKTYTTGAIVEYQNSYYRVVEGHTSGQSFDSSKFAKLPKIPVEGGREAYFRKAFKNTVEKMPYGKVLKTIQEVVDFILGYSYYLEKQGFVFDYYQDSEGSVANWKTSAKEFMFWTTQNWNVGSVITLSPAAHQVKFISQYSVVDDIYDTFYGYSLLKADGKKLKSQNVSLTRENVNEFLVKPKATEDGIYAVRLSLVQKEHVVIVDNKTVFGDIIYDQEPGYRQERMRVLGYKTADWDGSINIPGFIFDNAIVKEWQSWTDYAIGDLVQYKEFYYTARQKVAGENVFDANKWVRLDEKPSMELIPNFEYKTNQFADFYDLDTDNFDIEQQKFAQHLIGYQNRDYLANIINDDVSQYKFYQGMIQDKGTKNALTKLFDVLSSADKDSLEFYEEWAIKTGQYGAADGFDEVEFLLDESKFKLSPQSIELVNSVTGDETDLVYRIKPFDVYLRPENYNHAPFPEKYVTATYTKNSGYVNPDDVDFIVDTYDNISDIDYNDCVLGSIIWVGNVNRDWDIYTHIKIILEIKEVELSGTEMILKFTTTPTEFNVEDFIGVDYILGDGTEVKGFYKITSIDNNTVTVANLEGDSSTDIIASRISKLVSVRAESLLEGSEKVQQYNTGINRLWIDKDTLGLWKVIERRPGYNQHQVVPYTELGSDHGYGSVIATNANNTVLAVGAPQDGDGKVYIYTRAGNAGSYQLTQVIEADESLADSLQEFGASIDISEDGKFLAVGSPNASNVKTTYRDDYVSATDYSELDIVRYQDTLWKALTDIEGAEANIIFGSFESVPQIMIDLNQTDLDDQETPVILTGDYPFTNLNTDHFIVKAPRDMYEGSGVGDTLVLKWNDLTYANQDRTLLTSVEPFNGALPNKFTTSFLSGEHIIADKIDTIVYVENSNTIPLVGQIVETLGGFGTVSYRYNDGAKAVIYIKDQNGTFSTSGSLTTSIGEYVGEYVTSAPTDVAVGAEDKWGGYWRIDTSSYLVDEITYDQGRGLTYTDVIPSATDRLTYNDKYYYNILDYSTEVTSSFDTLHSQLITLSYTGNPGPNNVSGDFESNLFVLRAPKELTDNINIVAAGDSGNDTVDVFYNSMPGFLSGDFKDPATIGLNLSDINKTHTVHDLWDGWIDISLTKVDSNGNPYEPKVGLTVQDVTNLGTAVVTFYQKLDTINARIYVKGISGNWAVGGNFGENREIQWLSDGSGDPYYDPAIGYRVFGQIKQRSFPIDGENIGQFVVLSRTTNISVQNEDTILEGEYWFYKEQDVAGIARPANIPADGNNDWEQVYNLPVSAIGTTSGLETEGFYSIYERQGVGQFNRINAFTVPERQNNGKLGDDVKFSRLDNLYKLFVKMRGDADSALPNPNNPGRIYIINNGSTEDYTFEWEFSRDKKYKGEFSISRSYSTDDIVFYDGTLYTANTNLAPGAFNPIDWTIINDPKDYVGYIPNLSGIVVGEDLSTVIDSGYLSTFAKDFDVSNNGEVIVVSTDYYESKPNSVYVYRHINGSYYRAQTIDAPNETTSYGDNVSISADGKIIAVSAAFDDTVDNDAGKVYIYVQTNGQFILTQEIVSPTKERAELFGWTIDFDGDRLAVGSRNGDSFIETTFSDGTTFDSGFTEFKSYSKDTGIVRIYERQGNVLGFAEHIDYDQPNVRFFGRNIKLSNNHIYVGLPRYQRTETRQGIVVDYRIQDNTTVWNTLRSAKPTVNVDKIKRVMMYNVADAEIIQYLDYIDVLQGKIAGPAEQELTYKTYYDPAVYTTGNLGKVDTTNSWNNKQVGQLWWDLTNAKYLNPYQDNVIFSSNNWNLSFADINTIDVYEWVESTLLPSEWDEISGTDEGINQGITGNTKFGDDSYVVTRKYDTASGTFTTYYYYWVGNKTTIPNIEGRVLSAKDVADLIRDPAGEGYRYISFISPTQFALHNCDGLIKDTDIALSIQYWNIDNQEINIHNQYQIITEGLETSKPNRDIETKWIDSLVGFDTSNRPVPAPELSEKEKYGILNKPRQGWFVNREEALKQTITRVNSVLINQLIIDDKDITDLTQIDPAPTKSSNRYDRSVDTEVELQFVGVAKAAQAKLEPIIEDGKIVRVTIVDGGRGYLTAPTVTVLGNGIDASIKTEIDSVGTITNVIVEDTGSQYDDSTVLVVRRYTVLVEADSSLNGKWALYERDTVNKQWLLVESQAYDVQKYWEYADWYEIGYSIFTEIDYIVDYPYDLPTVVDSIGDIIKIKNVGSGGWLLLEKIDNQEGVDYSVNYKTIGRENGTIQFLPTLYDVKESLVGFDTTTYDVLSFDSLPTTETRIILETIRDKLFIDDVALEWNSLFFASLRYVFAEQKYVDWAFKTSFIKAKHNVGDLEQAVNFKNDNLESYEAYIKEVKPYKTKIREYLSSYQSLDNSQTVTTDFDLPPRYVAAIDSIKPQVVKVTNDSIIAQDADLETYPNKNWLDNVGYKITEIKLADAGQGYTNAPVIKIEGSGTGASAIATLGRNGSISGITVVSQGQGYLTSPNIIIDGAVGPGGREAKAVAILGNTPVRTLKTVVKFDRVSGVYEFVNLETSETFASSGYKITFDLEWPMDLRTTQVAVYKDGDEVLGRRYTYRNVLDTSKGYDRYHGQVEFIDPPEADTEIRIDYSKDIALLKAQDRINTAYNPTAEQFGKTLGQLMDGVDYGGVEIRSFDFGSTTGWDSGDWFTQGWDVYDTTFEDEIFLTKEIVLTFDDPVIVNANQTIIQNNTGATGRVKVGSTENELIIVAGFDQHFTNTDEIYGDDSTYLSDDSSSRTPSAVKERLLLTKPLENNVEYNVYRVSYDNKGQLVSNVRIDDADWDGSTIGTDNNENASMLPIQGDGVTDEVLFDSLGVDETLSGAENIISVVVRKRTSDGSFIADPESYDTALSGGNLVYGTATGLRSEDINVDGDGFVTQTTSKGPEEIVPGQVLDTLDITVYEKPTGGASQITARNYIGDGVTKTFSIGTEPGKIENLFVKVDYAVKTKDEYTIDFDTKELIFNTAPNNNSRVSIINVGVSAASILDIDTFEGDGETINFLTNARWEDNANSYVTVDGIVTEVTLIKSDASYEYQNNFVIRFPVPPRDGANISLMLAVGGTEIFEQYSQVTIDTFVADGSTTQFDLAQAPFETQPESAYTIVKVNDRILDPGYSESFVVDSNQREYQLDLTQIPVASVNAYDLAVYLNDIELEYVQSWTFEGAGNFDPNADAQSQPGSTITLEAGIGDTGDILKVYVLTDGEYRMGYYQSDNDYIKTPKTLNVDNIYNDGDVITVYQFSNHNSQGFERQKYVIEEKTELTIGTPEYYRFNLMRQGLLPLRKPARDAEFVWVVKNGNLLNPSVDYSVSDNKLYVDVVEEPTVGDEYQILHFANQIVTDKFGFRIFKDMLNRTHYKRLDNVYELAQPLKWYDREIIVVDADGLPQPEYNAKTPGIIFIEGERIEFFGRNNNRLIQLRRGTLGTGVKEEYSAGTFFMEQGIDSTMPYKDEEEIVTVTAGGYNKGSIEYDNSVGMNVTDISYDFNNNTAFPLGGQVCTVIGEGFTNRVEVYVGETQCPATFVSSTELTFITPELPVGAYDLIVVNPFTTVPIDTPQTSYVVPGGIEYVQVLLPFAPIPNPESATDWYKETIPEEYWEAQDIEVFVAGRRLRKAPISVYDYEAQDSPEGDITVEAEYAVNKNIGAYVRLTSPPPEGTQVSIIRKVGKTWSDSGIPLSQSDSDVAKFLRATTTDLPR